MWDAPHGTLHRRGRGHTDRIRACATSADGALSVSTGPDATVRIWTVPELHERAMMPLPGGGWCVAFHPHEPIVVCSGDGFVSTLELMPRS
jgi:hypothetical protein